MFKRLYRPFEINRALEVYSKVKSLRKTESIVKISKSTVHRWFHRFGYQGIKKRSLSRKRKKIEHIKKILTTVLDKNPFVTLASLQKNFQEKPSISTISRILKTLKYKRRKHVPKTYHCSKEMLEKRQKEFSQYIKDVDLSRVISIDETGFISTEMTDYGYSKGRLDTKPLFSFKRQKRSCVMAIGIDGILDYKVLDNCLRKDTFVSFFKDLVNKLPSHKNIIVMDNISFHHSREVKDLADSLNKQIIYSPPYSPQFNPIEFLFSVIKKKYREFVMNDTSFFKAIQLSIDTVTRDYKDIKNMFIHSLKTETLKVLQD